MYAIIGECRLEAGAKAGFERIYGAKGEGVRLFNEWRGVQMKTGVCPKCVSTSVHDGSEVPFKKGAYSQYAIKISAAFAAALDHYVCVDCGYVESYVASRSKLESIKATWPKVRGGTR